MSPVSGIPASLTDAHFDELAAGYGGAMVIAALTAAQGAKRRLLVRAVVDDLPTDTSQPLVDLLVAAERAAPGPVGRLLIAPHADAWLSRALQRLQEEGSAAHDGIWNELAAFSAAAAASARLTFELCLHSAAPDLVLPGLGAAAGIGTGTVIIRGNHTTLFITGPGGELTIGPSSTATVDTPAWLPLRQLSSGAPEVFLDDIDPYRACYSWTPLGRLSDPEFVRFRTTWDEATRILDDEHPRYADGIRASLRSLVPVTPPASGHTVSASSPYAYGAMAISPTDDPQQLAELAIHEVQHMKLYALLEHVDLHVPDGAPVHYAAWRADPRPVGALLQGTYAHLGVADYWRLRRRGIDGPWADYEFALWRRLVSDSIASLLGSGELTPAGERFSQGMARTIRTWDGEQVSAHCARLAEDVALGCRVHWRLANVHPSPAGMARLVAAWRRGGPCPPLDVPGFDGAELVVRPTQDIPRLRHAARAVAAGASANASADTLLIAGDYGAAATRYMAAIEAGGGADDWAGLAVAWHRLDRCGISDGQVHPAVVRDLFTALAREHPHPAPDELASWLSTSQIPSRGH
jgi:uncharacterized protein